MSDPTDAALPLECTIEQLLGASLEQLESMSDEEMAKRLEPILKTQEQIFLQLPSKKSSTAVVARPSTVPGAKMPAIRPGVDIRAAMNQGMTAQQIAVAQMAAAGIQLTPEMLLAMKEGRKV